MFGSIVIPHLRRGIERDCARESRTIHVIAADILCLRPYGRSRSFFSIASLRHSFIGFLCLVKQSLAGLKLINLLESKGFPEKLCRLLYEETSRSLPTPASEIPCFSLHLLPTLQRSGKDNYIISEGWQRRPLLDLVYFDSFWKSTGGSLLNCPHRHATWKKRLTFFLCRTSGRRTRGRKKLVNEGAVAYYISRRHRLFAIGKPHG